MKKIHLVNLVDANGESFLFGCASTPEKAQKMIELYKTEEKYKDCTFKITFCNVDTVILGENQEHSLTDDFTTFGYKKTSNWKITMHSQNVKFDFVCDFASEEEATKFAEENNWVYIDENEFEWILEVEEEEKKPQIMRPLTQQILDKAYEDWKELKSVIKGKDCTLETLCDELNGCNCYENHFDCSYNSISGVTIFKEPNGFKICDTAEIWDEEYYITEYNFAKMENNKNKSAVEQYANKHKSDKLSNIDKER